MVPQSLVGLNLLTFLREGTCAIVLPKNVVEIVIHSRATSALKFGQAQGNEADSKQFAERDTVLHQFYRTFVPKLYFNNPTVKFGCLPESEPKIDVILAKDSEQPDSAVYTKSIAVEPGDDAERVAQRFLSAILETSQQPHSLAC